jgi:hypothetical protein
MSMSQSRRAFLRRAVVGGGCLGCAGVSGLGPWPQVASAHVIEPAKSVALHPEIEPIVRLLEDTPRNKLIEAVAGRIRDGLAYRDVLAALLLAGVRNVEPRPSVGFKFHAVLVVQSVHLASLAASEADRWLPIFWALDYFKDSQARDERERGWTMGPVDESRVPPAERARDAFVQAMDRWDESKADAAVAGWVRSGQPDAIWELFWRYGARDYRSIGHKAIDVANSHRVLGVIGWRHAEPILRSLAYALLMHENGNPADRDDRADRPWRQNQELAAQIPDGWQRGEPRREGTVELLSTIRGGSEQDATRKVVELLRGGVGVQSIWDALFLAGGELLVRQPGIISLHSVTTTNALHYAYRATRDDRTRRLILLQNAAFLPMFRQTMRGRGRVGEFAVDRMEPLEPSGSDPVDEVFADVGRDPMTAARKTLAYIRGDNPLDAWIQQARRLVILKSTGAHDFKFGCAVLEDAAYVSQQWRANYLASTVFQLQGSRQADNPLVQRTRTAFAQ